MRGAFRRSLRNSRAPMKTKISIRLRPLFTPNGITIKFRAARLLFNYTESTRALLNCSSSMARANISMFRARSRGGGGGGGGGDCNTQLTRSLEALPRNCYIPTVRLSRSLSPSFHILISAAVLEDLHFYFCFVLCERALGLS